jgi:hypothetical protein
VPTRKRRQNRIGITHDAAFEILGAALAGDTRIEILDALESAGDFARARDGLRSAMRSHTFATGREPLALQPLVQSFNGRAQRSGLHVLESWDYRAHRFADEILPVLMLDRCALHRVPVEQRRAAMSVLLDHYFVSVLGLVAARAWDDGDPNENLDRVNRLLKMLDGAGNAPRFMDDAETLLLVAISHYHPQESAYDDLLTNVTQLSEAHRLRLALACAGALGGHLRWGLRYMYKRDVALMRADNTVDYPWLVFSLVTLWRELRRMHEANIAGPERDRVAAGFVNALAADPWLMTGKAPACLGLQRDEHAALCDDMLENSELLLQVLESQRPQPGVYSPLSFTCNFLCNAIVAIVATAVSDPAPAPSLNGLFAPAPRTGSSDCDAEAHAKRLMAYARAGATSSDVPALIVYDPFEAAHGFNVTSSVFGETVNR